MSRIILVLIVIFSLCKFTYGQSKFNEEERLAIYNEIIGNTIIREAWSPYKKISSSQLFILESVKLKKEFVQAKNDQELARAILKLSNLRRDRHLNIYPIAEGLNYRDTIKESLVRFYPDFSEGQNSYFVSDLTLTSPNVIRIGDELISVNGIMLDDYIDLLVPFIRYSTENGMRWQIARNLSNYHSLFDPNLYQKRADNFIGVDYTFRSKSTGELYSVSMNYGIVEKEFWVESCRPRYSTFSNLISTSYYDLKISNDKDSILLLNWKSLYSMDQPLDNALEYLVTYSDRNNLLDKKLIFNAVFSRGGSGAPRVLQILSNDPFKTTSGNVRISDITERLISDKGRRIKKWVKKSIRKGEDYSSNEPFKLRYFNEGSDGIMIPALKRFTGKKIGIFSSRGGSNLDQLLAMIVDNSVMYTIGYPTGGYSNTWEWVEDIKCPINKSKVVRYMWSIGQTIRPNGQVLEGNPAQPNEIINLTSENCTYYWDGLVDRALYLLNE